MPGFLYHSSATAICPHAGQVTVIPTNTKVLVSGMPVAVLSDVGVVAGCVFTVPGPKPQPCVKVQFLVPATKVLVNFVPALLQTSSGLCQSAEQIPAGPPTILVTQVKVMAT